MSHRIAILESVESVLTLLEHTGITYWSLRRHISALRRLGAWHFLRYGRKPEFPLSAETICLYLCDIAEDGDSTNRVVEQLMLHGFKKWKSKYTAEVLKKDVSVFSVLHSQHGWPNPCNSPSIGDCLSKIKQSKPIEPRDWPRGKPMRLPALIALLATCDDSLLGVRDRAILLLGWTTGIRKVSELGRLTVNDLIPTAYGYDWPLPPEIAGSESRCWWRATTIEGVAAVALDAWIDLSGFREGPLFFAAHPTPKNPGISNCVVTGMLAKRARMAGLSERFTSHSFGMGYDLESMSALPSLSFKLGPVPMEGLHPVRSRRALDDYRTDAPVHAVHEDETLRELDDLLRR